MAPREFDFTPIPQPAAPARDLALTASSDGSQPLSAARLVPLDRLLADPDQPRKTFDEETLDELATSLRTAGMRQPITAYYDDNLEAFVVVSGERRLIAARRAGLTHAPVLVEHRPTSDADKLVLQLAENLVREDLTVPDAARALSRLRELRPSDWLAVARQHGIGRRRAYQYLEHLSDPPILQEALTGKTISEGHAEEIRRLPDDRLPDVLKEVVENRLSVANTRRLIAGMKAAPPAGPVPTTAREGTGEIDHGDARASDTVTAGDVAEVLGPEPRPSSAAPSGVDINRDKARRERTRRLRLRLERIASELRNAHVDEIATDLDALPEIIEQARDARAGLDRFIALLERVRLDRVEAEAPPLE